MQRFLILVCLAACAQGAADEKRSALLEFSGALEQLAVRVAPAVVQVQVSAWCPSASANGEDTAVLASCRVIGSGVIVDPSGYIITNEHVVRNARAIRVMLTPKSLQPADAPAPRENVKSWIPLSREQIVSRLENGKCWMRSWWAQIANRILRS